MSGAGARAPIGAAARLQAVQAPVIPVMGEMIRQTPGTLSLGQGMVHWGPPAAALEAARDAIGDSGLHAYGAMAGEPVLLEALGRWLQHRPWS